MSNTSTFIETFIDTTAAFDAARFEYAIAGTDPSTLADAQIARDKKIPLSLDQELALVIHNENANEYDSLASMNFKPIRGFHLNWTHTGLVALSDRPWHDHQHDPVPDHVSLVAEIQDGAYKIEKLKHEDRQVEPLQINNKDRETIGLALAQLVKLKSLLSDL